MTGSGIPTIPIGVYFDKEARRLQKCIIRHFGKTDFHRWSMLHGQGSVIGARGFFDTKARRMETGSVSGGPGNDPRPGDPQNRGPHFNDPNKRHYDY